MTTVEENKRLQDLLRDLTKKVEEIKNFISSISNEHLKCYAENKLKEIIDEKINPRR